MKSISKLTDFYYTTLYPTLKKLDKEREHLRYRIIVISVIMAIFGITLLFGFKEFVFDNPDIIIFFCTGYIGLNAIIYKILTKKYTKKFKNSIIQPLIKEIDDTLEYIPQLYVSSHHFNRSQIFLKRPDKYSGNDLVRGKIDGVDIEFSDIYAQKRDKTSDSKQRYETIFRGLFIVSEFNKNFKARTVVLPDMAQNSFGDIVGNWIQSNNINRSELVKMDNSEFEKEFVVYSTDQIEARYILTPSLMQKIVEFKKGSKHPICLSFVGGNIYIAIKSNKDSFEPSVFRSLLKYKIAMQYINTLHLSIGIIEELKLNQKLWSKR